MDSSNDDLVQKRKFPWKTSYSSMPVREVEERIGITMQDLASVVILAKELLVQIGYSFDGEDSDAIMTTKEEVYKQIMRYLRIEGYAMETSPDFKEANVNDLVLLIISPILDEFICRTGRHKVRLARGKQIISEGSDTGGYEEFVVVDRISVAKERYVLVVEAKRALLSTVMKQCLLAMKDMGDSNREGVVYGFITTGESWRMLSYDGRSFQMTEKVDVVFEAMGSDKERWIRDYSVLVDCMYVALNNGDVVEGAIGL